MKRILVPLLCLVTTFLSAAEPAKREIYLLIGQSNMAGRGKVEAIDQQTDPLIWMFSEDGQWKPAAEPIRHDKPGAAGVGPGFAFARAMSKARPGVEIGIVNRAFGGTSIAQWKKGARAIPFPPGKDAVPVQLYEAALNAAKAALAQGTLKGILWHQGESDYKGKKFTKEAYQAELRALVEALRTDLNAPELPFVAGELGPYLEKAGDPPYTAINEALRGLSKELPKIGVASAEGLKDRGDHLHFDTASQRTFGERYAAEMLALQKK